MVLANPDGVTTNAGVEQAKLAIAGRRYEELARWAKREALYGVRMTDEHDTGGLGHAEVPQLHGVAADGAREDMLRSGVPVDLANLARRRVDAQHGREVEKPDRFVWREAERSHD